jgi:hypothetical protein
MTMHVSDPCMLLQSLLQTRYTACFYSYDLSSLDGELKTTHLKNISRLMTIHNHLTASFICQQDLVLDRKAVKVLPARFETIIIAVHNLGQSKLAPRLSHVATVPIYHQLSNCKTISSRYRIT